MVPIKKARPPKMATIKKRLSARGVQLKSSLLVGLSNSELSAFFQGFCQGLLSGLPAQFSESCFSSLCRSSTVKLSSSPVPAFGPFYVTLFCQFSFFMRFVFRTIPFFTSHICATSLLLCDEYGEYPALCQGLERLRP